VNALLMMLVLTGPT